MSTNILAVGPHPDDIEFGCFPILIKEAKLGNKIHTLVLSRGEAGTSGTPDQREQEAHAAAKLIGATIEFLDFGGDCNLRHSPENSVRIAEVIRKFKPAIVLAPYTAENQHPDHVAVAKCTRDACRLARYGGLAPLRGLPSHSIRNLYFYNITQHLGRAPDIVIDVTETVETWETAMNCHASQVKSKGYIELQKSAARLLGQSIGVEYAIGLFVNDPVRLDHLSELTLSARSF